VRSTRRMVRGCTAVQRLEGHVMDTSLYRSYNNDTKRQSKHNRKRLVATRLEPDDIQANRSWRRTVSILKLGDAKQELRELENDLKTKAYWSDVVESIIKQKIRVDKERVARLNARSLLSK
jgi:hypothetical protein